MSRKQQTFLFGGLLIVIVILYISKESSKECMTDAGMKNHDPETYRVHLLSPNVAQYGKKSLAYHPSDLTPDVAFMSEWTVRKTPYGPSPNADELVERNPFHSKNMGWIAEPGKFEVKYDCRPSLTGVYEDCGPYSWNIGDYGNKLTGCSCPLTNERT